MIEFGLTLGVGVIALLVAISLAFPLLGRNAKLRLITTSKGPLLPSIRGLLRANNHFLMVIVGLLVCTLLLGVGFLRQHQTTDPTSSYALAAWIIAGLLLGTLTTTLSIHLITHALLRTPYRINEAAKYGVTRIVHETIRSAGASTIALTSLLLLTSTSLGFTAFWVSGGFEPDKLDAANRVMGLTLTAYALGTVTASTLTKTLGGLFVDASRSLDFNGSPALIDIHLEVPMTRIPSFLSSAAIATAATTVICAQHWGSSLAIVLCPFVALSFSLLSCIAGVMVVRTDTTEHVHKPIDRGLWVTIVLNSATFIGLGHWLFSEGWWNFALAGICGLLAGLAALLLPRGLRDIDSPHASTLQIASLTGLVLLAGMVVGFLLGHSSPMAHGGTAGLVFATLGFIAPAPYVLLMSTAAAMFDRLLVSKAEGMSPNDTRRLSGESRYARVYYSVLATLVAWIAALALVFRNANSSDDWTSEPLQSSLVLTAVLVGAWLIPLQAGTVIRTAKKVSLSFRGQNDGTMQAATARHQAIRSGIPLASITMAIPMILLATLRFAVGASVGSATAMVGLVLGSSLVALPFSVENGKYPRISPASVDSSSSGDKSVDVDDNWANNRPDGVAAEGGTLKFPLQPLVGPFLHASVKWLATAALMLASLFY